MRAETAERRRNFKFSVCCSSGTFLVGFDNSVSMYFQSMCKQRVLNIQAKYTSLSPRYAQWWTCLQLNPSLWQLAV